MNEKIEKLEPQPTKDKSVFVSDFPYGFRQRTRKEYWIETTMNGQRIVTRTLNPKTSLWNKPKKSTYSDIRILYRNLENGHIENTGLSLTYAGQQELDKFLAIFPEDTLNEYQKQKIAYFRAILKTRKHLKISLVTNPSKEIRPHRNQQQENEQATTFDF